MSTKDVIFIGTMAYAFVATGLLWKLGLREHFGWFCLAALAGIPIPFVIERIWERI